MAAEIVGATIANSDFRYVNSLSTCVVDTFSQAKRRAIMQSVRRERTAPELALSLQLDLAGVKFDQNVEYLPGKPDFVFEDADLVVFVHGCFWRGHQHCRKGRSRPKSNRRFWADKIDRNRRRDESVARALRHLGYSVYSIWECELRRNPMPPRLVNRLVLTFHKKRQKCRNLSR